MGVSFTDKTGEVNNRIPDPAGTGVLSDPQTLAVGDTEENHHLPTVVLTTLLSMLCTWILMFMCWEATGRPLSRSNMSLLAFLPILIAFFVISLRTGIRLRDLRQKPEKLPRVLLTDLAIAAGGVAILALAKVLLTRFFPGAIFDAQRPFFDLSMFGRLPILYYPLNVVAQEFASRSVLHGLLRKCYYGQNGERLAVFVSVLIFGIFHIHMGFAYMLFAMFFPGLLAILYAKQKTIWGLCIIHYAFGIAATGLGFIG